MTDFSRMADGTCSTPPNQSERRQSCQHAEEAAHRAVKKTFAILGVDVDVPKDVEAFRMDLRFGAQLRKASEKGRLAFIGAIGVVLATIIVAGVKHYIEGK